MPATPTPISAALLDAVLVYANIRHFSVGEPILSPESASNAFYYLVSGTVEVSSYNFV